MTAASQIKAALLLMWLSCFCCWGETNQPPSAPHALLDAGSSSLRPVFAELPPVATSGAEEDAPPHKDSALKLDHVLLTSSSTNTTDSPGVNLTATDPFDMSTYRSLEKQGYLTRPELPSNNRIVRAFETAWDPVVVRVGKTEITSSFITAIKRKNPLALLNPVVFNLSW